MLCALRGNTVDIALKSLVLFCFVCHVSFLSAKKKPWDWVIDINISIELRGHLCALLWDRYANK